MKYSALQKWQRLALPAVAILLVLYFLGRYLLAGELFTAQRHADDLQAELRAAHEQLEAERSRTVVAQREAEVLRQANALLRTSERDRQDEIAALKADLAFYRRLGGANGSQAPLAVHHVELQATRSPRVFRLIFTLTQNLRWAAVISGRVELGVDGIRNGVAEYLSGDQLLAEPAADMGFRFKYFQQFERLITLPEGFSANRLTLRLRSAGLKAAVEHSLEWRELVEQAEPGEAAASPR